MSLIEKIDELEKYLVKNNSYFEGAEWLFGKVREAILSEQKEPIGNSEQLKEPCHICQDTSNDRYYRNQGYKYCPHCGCSLDVADTNAGKILTIGDKIRESNESLAELIRNFDNICNYCIAYKPAKCRTTSCAEGVREYLNQPCTEQ